jgi:xylan 1,4-beta-xylosidase
MLMETLSLCQGPPEMKADEFMNRVNPVLRGAHPDPSACRVGDDVFLVTSTFSYHPGIPVHRSRDLRSWELVGHVLTDHHPGFEGLDVSDGVWAPTIRHAGGRFYVVYSIARGRSDHRTFVTTAEDPAGPWTPPVALDADGFDPSLFFDLDGRAWFTACRDATEPGTGPGEIWIREFDPTALRLTGPSRVIWHGSARDTWVEAPHLYRRGRRYLLLAAEGGTERMHAVTAAWADSPTGPFRSDPRNPLLTHRHLGGHEPVQNVGHADLVDLADGSTWAVLLGVRIIDGVHVTGRETFATPVTWEGGAPVFAAGVGRMLGDSSDRSRRQQGAAELEWISLRGPALFSVVDDDVRLEPVPSGIDGRRLPAFVGVRQTEPAFRWEAVPHIADPDVRSALVAFAHQDRFLALEFSATGSSPTTASLLLHDGAGTRVVGRTDGVVTRSAAWIESDGAVYRAGVGRTKLGEVEARFLSAEDAGGFFGVVLGLSAVGPVGSAPATFGSVSYTTGAMEEGGPELLRTTSIGGMR